MWSLASASLTRVDCRKKKKTRMRKAGKGPKTAGPEGRKKAGGPSAMRGPGKRPGQLALLQIKRGSPGGGHSQRCTRREGLAPHPSLPALGTVVCALYLWPFGIFQMKQIPYLPRLFFFSMEIESLLSLGTDKTAWHHSPGVVLPDREAAFR